MRISLVAAVVNPLFQLSGTFGTCLEIQHLFTIHLRVPSLLNSNISPWTVTCSSVRVKKAGQIAPLRGVWAPNAVPVYFAMFSSSRGYLVSRSISTGIISLSCSRRHSLLLSASWKASEQNRLDGHQATVFFLLSPFRCERRMSKGKCSRRLWF